MSTMLAMQDEEIIGLVALGQGGGWGQALGQHTPAGAAATPRAA
jgi:hypothetical protein